MLATFSALAFAAHAADDFKGFTFSGHLDYYYQYDFGKPPTPAGVNLRQFDVKNNQFGFSVLQLNISRKASTENPFGITANFTIGKNTDIIHANEPGGVDSTKLVQQLYVTYNVPKSEVTVDFGKFLSWIGYEGVVSADNDNYSRSFLYTLGQPIYHTGLRATAPINKALSASLYAVNGWNEVEDSNGGKSIGATLAYTLSPKTAITANYIGGNEGSNQTSGIGFTSTGTRNVNMGDLIITHQLTDKVKLALNADYADAKTSSSATGGKWSGIAGYVSAQLSDKLSGAIRYETVSDSQGLRALGTPARFNSLSGTLSFATSKDSLFRVEVRYDKSNVSAFTGEGGILKDNRTTLTFSHVLRF